MEYHEALGLQRAIREQVDGVTVKLRPRGGRVVVEITILATGQVDILTDPHQFNAWAGIEAPSPY